jgi:shikimate dehydrogenase
MIMNRTLGRIDELVRLFGPQVRPFEGLGSKVRGEVDLLINTTSLGMVGQPALDFDLSVLPETALVVDIVYVPLETRLLSEARRRGLRTVSGLSMLLHQAVPGFERWFGQKPQVTESLRRLIEADVLGEKSRQAPGQN